MSERSGWGPAVSFVGCGACGRPYSDPGFQDLIVPDEVWRQISPTGDSGGLLCPSCIIGYCEESGITGFSATFKSGLLTGATLVFPDYDARPRDVEFATSQSEGVVEAAKEAAIKTCTVVCESDRANEATCREDPYTRPNPRLWCERCILAALAAADLLVLPDDTASTCTTPTD